jgi:fibronectin type 3 domain-containing protein
MPLCIMVNINILRDLLYIYYDLLLKNETMRQKPICAKINKKHLCTKTMSQSNISYQSYIGTYIEQTADFIAHKTQTSATHKNANACDTQKNANACTQKNANACDTQKTQNACDTQKTQNACDTQKTQMRATQKRKKHVHP